MAKVALVISEAEKQILQRTKHKNHRIQNLKKNHTSLLYQMLIAPIIQVKGTLTLTHSEATRVPTTSPLRWGSASTHRKTIRYRSHPKRRLGSSPQLFPTPSPAPPLALTQ